MARNRWGEPMPRRLAGALGEAWAHEYMTNEGFDGEDAIAAGVQERLIRDWNTNGPATLTTFDGYRLGRHPEQTVREVPTLREAYRLAIAHGECAYVRPLTR